MPPFPFPLDQYTDPAGVSLFALLQSRIAAQPFNAVATGIFFAAVLHTFVANRFRQWAHDVQHASDAEQRARGRTPTLSFRAEILHFFGEVEVVFGLWAVALAAAIALWFDWETAQRYGDTVNYTEPLFVVVIMAMAATRPIVGFARACLGRLAALGGSTTGAWWMAILTVGPLIGSFITEPAAMTICAMLLARSLFMLRPSPRLAYATLGLLFVNVSIGGTLTHFAAPPVLMVARPWEWTTAYMLSNIGWKAALAIALSSSAYYAIFRGELRALNSVAGVTTADDSDGLPAVPAWVTAIHLGFLALAVLEAHHPALFIGAFLFFLGFAQATAPYQSAIDLKPPLLVGFFLAGLVVHGGLQGWWIAPLLGRLGEQPLFWSATILTAFNDNALITYLATLVPHLDEAFKYAVVTGAVTGGGLTVIANAPNPAGQAILGKHFEGGVSPLSLMLWAVAPTAVAAACFLIL